MYSKIPVNSHPKLKEKGVTIEHGPVPVPVPDFCILHML